MNDRDFDVILFGATGFTGTHIIHVSQEQYHFSFLNIYVHHLSLDIYVETDALRSLANLRSFSLGFEMRHDS